MAQQRKSLRHKSLRRKSLRHKNRTTLKRGGVKDTKSKSVKAEKASHNNEPSSIVYFPRTSEHTHNDDDDEWEKDFKHLKSKANKARIERVHKRYQQEQLDKHIYRIPEIMQHYQAKLVDWDIELGRPNYQYYFDILGIPLKEACSITDAEVNAKYTDIIEHPLLHEYQKKFVKDAKEKLRSQNKRIYHANEIPWQEYQLKVREYEESIIRFINYPNTYSILPEPPPYEHKILCDTHRLM
jgi:hypothetical protein